MCIFFFKQKTAYEMRISDWSSDVCSSDLWFDVFAWSGRDLYRPGETVRVSALFRDNDGKPVAAKDKGAQPLFVRLKQPDGKTFVDSRIEAGELGYFQFEKAIPVDAP